MRDAAAELEGVEYFEAKERGEALLDQHLQLVWVSESDAEKKKAAKNRRSPKTWHSPGPLDNFKDWRNHQGRNGVRRSIVLRLRKEHPYRLNGEQNTTHEQMMEMVDAELLVMYNERQEEIERDTVTPA